MTHNLPLIWADWANSIFADARPCARPGGDWRAEDCGDDYATRIVRETSTAPPRQSKPDDVFT